MSVHRPAAVPTVATVSDISPYRAPRQAYGMIAPGATVAGLGAIVASSCCVIPPMLASFGARVGVFGILRHSPLGGSL